MRQGALRLEPTPAFAHPPACLLPCPHACLPSCSVRNYLHSSWVNRHAYRLHVVCAGLMITVICLVGSGWVGVWD
jgi:hypothetical protein